MSFYGNTCSRHENEGLIAISLHPGAIKSDKSEKLPDFFRGMFVDGVELPADTIIWLSKERREWLNARFVFGNWELEKLEIRKDEIVGRDLVKFRITL